MRTRLDFKKSELNIRVRYRDLPDGIEDNGSMFRADVAVETNTANRREFSYEFLRSGRSRAEAILTGNRYGQPMRCRFAHTVDFGEDLVEIRIPSRCVRNPKWVRVAVGTVVWVNDRRETFTWDDSFDNGLHHASSDFSTAYSPRVRAVD